MTRLVAGLDLGSTGIKLLVADEHGTELAIRQRPTPWKGGSEGTTDLYADHLLSTVAPNASSSTVGNLSVAVGSASISIAGALLITEYFLKPAYTRDTAAMVGLKYELQQEGVQALRLESKVDWGSHYENANRIVAILSEPQSFRQLHWPEIVQRARSAGVSITILVPLISRANASLAGYGDDEASYGVAMREVTTAIEHEWKRVATAGELNSKAALTIDRSIRRLGSLTPPGSTQMRRQPARAYLDVRRCDGQRPRSRDKCGDAKEPSAEGDEGTSVTPVSLYVEAALNGSSPVADVQQRHDRPEPLRGSASRNPRPEGTTLPPHTEFRGQLQSTGSESRQTLLADVIQILATEGPTTGFRIHAVVAAARGERKLGKEVSQTLNSVIARRRHRRSWSPPAAR
ncbi:hypothetical protein [Georgenia sp. SUBG003]|uniref:hypothetical protein n=1 Tax=Georgenia sp. SUBG003 TaxID=1497974 RepID=UPI003AB826CC